jgi:hypothetical protein
LGRKGTLRGPRSFLGHPLGVKDLGKLKNVGVNAVVANAVFHATGRSPVLQKTALSIIVRKGSHHANNSAARATDARSQAGRCPSADASRGAATRKGPRLAPARPRRCGSARARGDHPAPTARNSVDTSDLKARAVVQTKRATPPECWVRASRLDRYLADRRRRGASPSVWSFAVSPRGSFAFVWLRISS